LKVYSINGRERQPLLAEWNLQGAKNDSQITSTEHGMWIARNSVQPNAPFSKRHNLEFASNVTEASDLRQQEHDSQIASTEHGMRIEYIVNSDRTPPCLSGSISNLVRI
jgi:hypothetical protein